MTSQAVFRFPRAIAMGRSTTVGPGEGRSPRATYHASRIFLSTLPVNCFKAKMGSSPSQQANMNRGLPAGARALPGPGITCGRAAPGTAGDHSHLSTLSFATNAVPHQPMQPARRTPLQPASPPLVPPPERLALEGVIAIRLPASEPQHQATAHISRAHERSPTLELPDVNHFVAPGNVQRGGRLPEDRVAQGQPPWPPLRKRTAAGATSRRRRRTRSPGRERAPDRRCKGRPGPKAGPAACRERPTARPGGVTGESFAFGGCPLAVVFHSRDHLFNSTRMQRSRPGMAMCRSFLFRPQSYHPVPRSQGRRMGAFGLRRFIAAFRGANLAPLKKRR